MAQRWQGHIQIEHEKLANGRLRTAVRLEPLNGPSALRQELAAVVERLNVEKAVSEGLIPGYRQNLKQWEDRLAMDRRLGRPTTGTPTALQTTAAATFLNLEESRVGRLEAMIAQATEARIRAEHAERSAP